MSVILPADINTIINSKIASLIAEYNYDICADIRDLRLRFYANTKIIRGELVDIPFIVNFMSLKKQRQRQKSGTFTKRIIFVDEPEDSTPFDFSALKILTSS